jgi:hypothetical protein
MQRDGVRRRRFLRVMVLLNVIGAPERVAGLV